MPDVRGIHLQKSKRLHRDTIKTHDILNEDRILRHNFVGLLAEKINEDHFRVSDPTCGLCGDQIVHKAGQMPLVIDVTILKAITPIIKNRRGKLQSGVKAQTCKVSISVMYQELLIRSVSSL